jgi:hypothetical protein
LNLIGKKKEGETNKKLTEKKRLSLSRQLKLGLVCSQDGLNFVCKKSTQGIR